MNACRVTHQIMMMETAFWEKHVDLCVAKLKRRVVNINDNL